MRLHKNTPLYADAVRFTSQQMGLPPEYVEKDYWVTFVLYHVFKSDVGRETVFKGGTALSKCFRLIQRFSEDVDLAVLRNGGETANQLRTKIRKVTECVSDALPEIEMEGLTNKTGTVRKTAHGYEKVFAGPSGQVGDHIVVESTWLGNPEPYTTAMVSSFIYETMLQNNHTATIEGYGMDPFGVLVLAPQRTLCEKIMSLVRFSHTRDPIADMGKKIRHAYDIHLMLQDRALGLFFQSDGFGTMLLKVARDDATSFRNNNQWLANHPAEAMIFSDTASTWGKIRNVYKGVFKDLVFGDLPKESEIVKSLTSVSDRLKETEWG